MKVFLLRHADDPHEIIGGWSDIGLTGLGKKQAAEIANYFTTHENEMGIKHIISSDLKRAQDSVLPTSQALKLEMITNEGWRGLDWGELNGCSSETAKKLYPYLNLQMMQEDESFPKGESPKGFYQRAVDTWQKTLKQYDGENLLICTHGINMMALEAYLTGKKWQYNVQRTFYPCVLMEIDLQKHIIQARMLYPYP